MHTFSIKKRFAVSLATNLFRSGVSFGTGLLLARWLGVDDYGRMAFLIATFLAFKQLLDMSSYSAFFTFISQRPRSKYFVEVFWWWIIAQIIISILVVWVILPDDIINSVWSGESRGLVVLALVATFLQHSVWEIALKMAEAQRENIKVQLLITCIVFVHLAFVFMLWFFGKLLIPIIFVGVIFEWAVASWLAFRMYKFDKAHDQSGNKETPKSVFLEFWHYCLPFIPYVWLGFAHDFADRWMLQHWGGSKQQAYFAIALQFSIIILLVTSSILGIFWKEIAEAKQQNDVAKILHLYKKISRGSLFISAIFAGWLSPWAGEIISLLLGTNYSDGALVLMVMFFYPQFQASSQLDSVLLLATENGKVVSICGMLISVVSVIMVYFILAPSDLPMPGFGLGSAGLGFKMVLLCMLYANILSWVAAKIFGWKYDFSFQFVILAIAVISSWAIKLFITMWLTTHTIIILLVASVLYFSVMVALVFNFPWLAGLDKLTLNSYLYSLKIALKNIIS